MGNSRNVCMYVVATNANGIRFYIQHYNMHRCNALAVSTFSMRNMSLYTMCQCLNHDMHAKYTIEFSVFLYFSFHTLGEIHNLPSNGISPDTSIWIFNDAMRLATVELLTKTAYKFSSYLIFGSFFGSEHSKKCLEF